MTDLNDIDIHELLPQQEPFVMVDKLTHFDEKKTCTRFAVRQDNLFIEEGRLDACALAENVAQTCAARLGYVNKYILKRAIQIGFIGAIRGMKVFSTPKVGDVLETSIEIVEQIMDLTLVNAIVKVGDKMITTAEMKIALAEEVMQ
ncbi:pseudouridylate synthase [Prevotella sp. oral taxon 376]|uniref:pseudouridylate synthase n=1 Tax=Prevotella sp. oral taxon 376 TaxID=712466 RepID=UPI000D1E84E2|nr:pseudouridylate synthase [Prevotella sp. oral taxon 376]PTL33136.1 pseudouridylate synthase [Prevotella sp. oral taxon 376]